MKEFLPALFVVITILIELQGSKRRKHQYKELMQFSDFLADLTDEFYLCKSVTESIYRAVLRTSGSLRQCLLTICYRLEGDTSELSVYELRLPRHLKYVKLFYLQCINAVQFGCGKKGEETRFVRNLTELRRDVQNECYKRTQAGFLFAGFGFIAVVPALFLPLIRAWGMSNMPELATFYDGFYGRLAVLVFWVLLLLCYFLLRMVRQTDEIVYQRPKWLDTFFHTRLLRQLCKLASGTRAERIGRRYLLAIGLEKNGMEFCVVFATFSILMAAAVYVLAVLEGIALPMLVAVLSFFAGGMVVVLVYRYLAYLRRLSMSGETLSLQSVVLLLFEAPNMTIGKLLETMEDYSVIFKRTLVFCTDCYASEEQEALQRLCETAEYPPFRQLANRLVISERLGLVRAFAELAADRYFFREQQRLDTEHDIKKKAANAQVIAFVPLFFLLFLYLILPFLTASLSQMTDIFAQMDQMKVY